jgi:hypothetical protein
VWNKLEEKNPKYFAEYHTRSKLKEQVVMFNYLLEQQVGVGSVEVWKCGRKCGSVGFAYICRGGGDDAGVRRGRCGMGVEWMVGLVVDQVVGGWWLAVVGRGRSQLKEQVVMCTHA